MGYIRQVFSAGSVLTADQMNQVEENIASHLHQSIPQNLQNSSYTLTSADGGYHLYHNIASQHAYTIPGSSAAVSFPIGTALTFVNANSSANLFIICSDTMVKIGSGSTDVGTRTVAPGGMATALKVGATSWVINGTGLA